MIQKTLANNFNIKQNQITAVEDQNMDNRLSSRAMAAPIVSRGLLLSKSCQTLYTLPSSSKINSIETKDSLAISNQSHGRLGPKLLEVVRQKLRHGAKILPLGHERRILGKHFSTRDTENLLHATRCSIYTTAGSISGVLFITAERVGFCSDKSFKTYSAAGEVLKFQYKVSIPLEKIKEVGESVNTKRPSNKYAELVTVDNFSFWFLGFPNYKKTLRFLLQRIGHNIYVN